MLYVKANSTTEAVSKVSVEPVSDPDVVRIPDYVEKWPGFAKKDIIHWMTMTLEEPGKTPIFEIK